MKFTEDDIKDKIRLEKLIHQEAKRIHESPAANRGRSYENVVASVRQGKVAELFLVESGNYDFANIRWHDLIDKNGDYVEVKAYKVNNWDAPYVKRDLERYRTEDWCKAKWYMLFSYDNGTYEYLGNQKIK
jgi:hypothetical protein